MDIDLFALMCKYVLNFRYWIGNIQNWGTSRNCYDFKPIGFNTWKIRTDTEIYRIISKSLCYTIKKNKIAFIYCFENLAIKEKIHGTKFHLDVAETLSSLAYLYEELEDFDEALKYCQLVYGKIYLFLLKLN